jgi:hypothetical protein
MARRPSIVLGTLVLISLLFARIISAAPIVWSGLTTTFSKANLANPLLAANQDAITASVKLTRGSSQGLFNAASESSYSKATFAPPTGTAWATDLNNPGKSITAANFAALTFGSWRSAYANHVGPNIVNRDAVVHLTAEDIYLDLRFTAWTSGGAGGGFTYIRSAAPSSPTGDYNGNHLVDAADYVVWRNTNGQTGITPGTGADGDQSGSIGAGDYTFWRARFGNAAGSGADGVDAVPEPAAGLLLAVVALSLSLARARR